MAFADAVYLTASATLFSFGQRRVTSSSALGGALRRLLLLNHALLTDILYI